VGGVSRCHEQNNKSQDTNAHHHGLDNTSFDEEKRDRLMTALSFPSSIVQSKSKKRPGVNANPNYSHFGRGGSACALRKISRNDPRRKPGGYTQPGPFLLPGWLFLISALFVV